MGLMLLWDDYEQCTASMSILLSDGVGFGLLEYPLDFCVISPISLVRLYGVLWIILSLSLSAIEAIGPARCIARGIRLINIKGL